MKDGTDRVGRAVALTLGLAATLGAALALAPLAESGTTLAAQERESCRCVDRDGNEIENCRCLRGLGRDRGVFSLEAGPWFQRRAQIGVSISEAQEADADREGARILSVRAGGPADQAGIREGDIVVRVDGRSVFDPLEDGEAEEALDLDRSLPVQRFMRLVGQLEPGEEVELEILRDGRRRTVTLTPERAQGMVAAWSTPRELSDFRVDSVRLRELGPRGSLRMFFPDSVRGQGFGERFGRAWAADPCLRMGGAQGERVFFLGGGNCVDGVELIELNPELGEYFGTDEGVLVAEAAEESTLGLRPGDVLIAIDGREVTDPEHARRILASYRDDEEVRLRIRRRGEEMEVLGTRR